MLIRPEMVVGWYHSHPGFGCWLSGVDINTQQSFEALSERAVAVVVDPIQSVKGKVKLCGCCRGTCYSVTVLLGALHKICCVMICFRFWIQREKKLFVGIHVRPSCSAGCYWCLQTDQCQHDGVGSWTKTNHVQSGSFEQTLNPGNTLHDYNYLHSRWISYWDSF